MEKGDKAGNEIVRKLRVRTEVISKDISWENSEICKSVEISNMKDVKIEILPNEDCNLCSDIIFLLWVLVINQSPKSSNKINIHQTHQCKALHHQPEHVQVRPHNPQSN